MRSDFSLNMLHIFSQVLGLSLGLFFLNLILGLLVTTGKKTFLCLEEEERKGSG